MCGLFGFDGTAPDRAALELVAELASRRGPHAGGFAWEAGGAIAVERRAEPWSKWAAQLWPRAGAAPRIVGHFRLATSGDWRRAEDAQPVTAGDLALAHNGNVERWRERAAADGHELTTNCDSELVARWMAADTGPLADRLANAAARLRAKHVLLAVRPGEVASVRQGLPLFVWRRPEGVYYCSVRPAPEAELTKETAHGQA